MLLERAALLVERAREHKVKTVLSKEAKGFETRARSIDVPTQELIQLYRLASEFRLAGLEVDFATGLASALAAQAQVLLTKFNGDPKSFLAADETFTQAFLPAIRKISADHRARLLSAWQSSVAAQFSPLPESVLEALRTVAAFRHQIDSIHRRHKEVLALRAELPQLGTVATAIASVRTSAAAMDSSLRELLGDGVPIEVVEFLSQAGSIGFSLADFTPAIHDWLRKQHLLGAFRIRAA